MTETSRYSDLLHRILSGIAHEPVIIETEEAGSRRFNFKATIDYRDMGLCLGRHASVIQALQKIFRLIAHNNRYVHFGVWMTADREVQYRWNKNKPDWDQKKALDLAYDILSMTGHELKNSEVKEHQNGCELIVWPEIPEPWLSAIHTILEAYGKSYGKVFGISF